MEWRRSHLAQSGEPDGQEKLAPRTVCLEIVRTASLHPREAQLARGEGSASVHTGLSTDHGRIALGDEGREVDGTAPQGDREPDCPTGLDYACAHSREAPLSLARSHRTLYEATGAVSLGRQSDWGDN